MLLIADLVPQAALQIGASDVFVIHVFAREAFGLTKTCELLSPLVRPRFSPPAPPHVQPNFHVRVCQLLSNAYKSDVLVVPSEILRAFLWLILEPLLYNKWEVLKVGLQRELLKALKVGLQREDPKVKHQCPNHRLLPKANLPDPRPRLLLLLGVNSMNLCTMSDPVRCQHRVSNALTCKYMRIRRSRELN